MERALILGASRGLGAALVRHLCSDVRYPVTGFGRKPKELAALQDQFPLFDYRVVDFSTRPGQEETLTTIQSVECTKIFYVAGGGPYGPFAERAWKDHLWAWEVSFLFAARVVHAVRLAHRDVQVLLVGSSVAESSADPGAASYSAAKHALVGLVRSIRAEAPDFDLRLFSPGYMDTDMLPKNAPARQLGVYPVAAMARDLWTWSLSTDKGGHRVYPPHPA